MNTKLLYLTFILVLISGSLSAQKFTYTLQGKIADVPNESPIYLKTFNDSKSEIIIVDSTIVTDGSFSFTEKFDKPKQIRFVQSDNPSNAPLLFVLEQGTIKMVVANGSNTISGTPENDKLQSFMNKELQLIKEGNRMASNYKLNGESTETYQVYLKESEPIMNEIKNNRYEYITQNIDSDLGEFMLLSSLELLPADTILTLLSQTRKEFQNSKTCQDLIEYYEPQLAKTTGSQFADLTLTDMNGKEVKLSDFAGKGKVVLLDFWASWCPPCIKEMPSLVELYKEYKNKGLEIVGISLDDKKDSWIGAIKRHQITWPQMSDLKGWNSSVVKAYGVYSIPLTVLIDQQGTVVGSNLSSAELKIKLNQLLNFKNK